MRGLNLDQLRALLEVVEQGSFSAAARRLNLTQPAVSLQILVRVKPVIIWSRRWHYSRNSESSQGA